MYRYHVAYANSLDKKLAGEYELQKDADLRCGAGDDKELRMTMKTGEKVRCYGYYTAADNTKWLYVQYRTGGELYAGFCSEAYLKAK